MLSGGRSQFVALKAKMPWLDINQERHHAYAGYDGMVELVRRDRQGAVQPDVGSRCAARAVGQRGDPVKRSDPGGCNPDRPAPASAG